MTTTPSNPQRRHPGTPSLVAAGSGTAMASVCAIGLFQIEQLVGGLWSVLAILIAASLCVFLAKVFSRLAAVLPSGAGLIAFISRAYSRKAGVAVVVPYLFMMLFLVGFEALIVGGLLEYLSGIPPMVGAVCFVIVTWLVCRSGLKIGYQAQSWTTAALFFGLVGVSMLALLEAGANGQLLESLLPGHPRIDHFFTAIGQALFLFLGFELLTSHVEVAKPGAVSRSLFLSVVVLFVFYAAVSLGLSSLDAALIATQPDQLFIPQLAIAAQSGSTTMVIGVAIICALASFTSFNGALLALSRFIYALAVQGTLPKSLAQLDRQNLTAKPALNLLLFAALLSTLIMASFRLYELAILAAAVTASWVYAISVFAYERPPFVRGGVIRRSISWAIAVILLGLGIAVIDSAGNQQRLLIVFLLLSYGFGLGMAWQASRRQQNKPTRKTPSSAQPTTH